MKVTTARFGEVEVSSDRRVNFLNPILGFEEYREFISISQEDSPFEFIQSLEDQNLTFILIDPFLFCPNYEFTLEERWLNMLNIEREDQVIVRSVVTARSDSDISMNLKAPIILNVQTLEAAQIILEGMDYTTRHPLTSKRED